MISDGKRIELPELLFKNRYTECVGVDPVIVSKACEGLTAYARDMKEFITELEEMQAVIQKDWEGTAAETFRELFPGLMEAFSEVPASIISLAEWAESYTGSMVSHDEIFIDGLALSLGGR